MPIVDISAQVLAFSFSDGRNIITNNSVTNFIEFEIGTDALGMIDTWNIQLFTPLGLDIPEFDIASFSQIRSLGFMSLDGGAVIVCTVVVGQFCDEVDGDVGRNFDQPGTWTIQTPVPLPSSLALLGLGLLSLKNGSRRGA